METLAAMAPVFSIVSGVVGAVGSIMQGQSQSEMYNYQAQVERNNAQIAKQNAVFATEIGESQATQQGMKTRAIVGAEKAGQAASGIDVNTGSAVDVRASTAQLGELNALTIRSNAARQAYGYQVQSTSDIAQADLDTFAASNAKTAGYFGAVGSLLGAAASAGSAYSQWQLASPSSIAGITDASGYPTAAFNTAMGNQYNLFP